MRTLSLLLALLTACGAPGSKLGGAATTPDQAGTGHEVEESGGGDTSAPGDTADTGAVEPSGDNLLRNPGFEAGSLVHWTVVGDAVLEDSAAVVLDDAYSAALRGEARIAQTVDVDPDTVYTLTMAGRVSAWGDRLHLSLDSDDGALAWVLPLTWEDRQARRLSVRTGPSTTQLTVGVSTTTAGTDGGAVTVDAFSLVAHPPLPEQTWIAPPAVVQGADLSFVNELEDCGVVYSRDGVAEDPFEMFAATGTNVLRVRLWNDPELSAYSGFDDVAATVRRAKDAGMAVMLDFHYSDTWADPGAQSLPADWQGATAAEVADLAAAFTWDTLFALQQLGLQPEYVQLGNEIGNGMMWPHGRLDGSDAAWRTLADLLTHTGSAARDVAPETTLIVHIADVEQAHDFVGSLTRTGGFTDFDVFGVSYYPWWSPGVGLDELSAQLFHVQDDFDVATMVVETAYPWTTGWADDLGNVPSVDGLDLPWEVSEAGQAAYLAELFQASLDGGAAGVIPWEPAWVSSACETPWGQGSAWENATFFDFDHDALDALTELGAAHAPQLLDNGGFERCDLSSWTSEGAVAASGGASERRSGWCGLWLAGGDDAVVRQEVAVVPGRTYAARMYGRVGTWGEDTLRVGVWDQSGAEVTADLTWTDFQQADLVFTAEGDHVTVWAWNAGASDAWLDDVRLVEVR